MVSRSVRRALRRRFFVWDKTVKLQDIATFVVEYTSLGRSAVQKNRNYACLFFLIIALCVLYTLNFKPLNLCKYIYLIE